MSNSNCIPVPPQGWDMSFATPSSSPSRRASLKLLDSSLCDSPPLKQQRLFSPSPGTPSKNFSPFSYNRDSLHSLTSRRPLRDSNKTGNDDIMMFSPPKLERLQLFDSPQTPMSIAKSSGMLPRHSVMSRWACVLHKKLIFSLVPRPARRFRLHERTARAWYVSSRA